ncbi:MAG: protein-glutamine gamma-glutamyltransferase [Eubacteriales bacterium]|jgi:protein-glutamine gamma-glutamyltransferase|nr:protein-glutamine gamma-glutamyltransferase [Eubacteriales bacterium]
MITVAGALVDDINLLDFEGNDKLISYMFDTLKESQKNFRYKSMEYLEFELKLRSAIVSAAADLYRSKLSFAVFRYSYCNTELWTRTENGGFLLKNGISPAAAIEDIYTNGHMYGTECATAMVIVYYKALLDVYPKALYDSLFKRIYLMNWHDIDKNLREVGRMRKPAIYLPGDRRYVKNPEVNPLTPQWQGENLIDLSDGKYYGHGMGIVSIEAAVAALNRNRKEGATTSAYLMDEAGRPNFDHLCNILINYNRGQ